MDTSLTQKSPAARVMHFPGFLPWLLLTALTALSWWLGYGLGVGKVATIAVLILAFFKVNVVGAYFMELRFAPLALKLVFNGWTLFVCAVLIGIYLVVH
jgi:hypothetical protein